MALLAVAAFVLTLANSVAWVLAGQFLIGTAIGMDFPAASAYVAETMPAAERQKMVVGTITFQAVGMVLASSLGVWLLEPVRPGGGVAPAVRRHRRGRGPLLRLAPDPAREPPLARRARPWTAEAVRVAQRLNAGPRRISASSDRGPRPSPGRARLRRAVRAGVPAPHDPDRRIVVPHGHRDLWRRHLHAGDPAVARSGLRRRFGPWSIARSMSAGRAVSSTCSCCWAS